MYISSKHGQPYSCSLPEVVPDGEDNNEEDELKTDDVHNILDKSFNDTCLTHVSIRV